MAIARHGSTYLGLDTNNAAYTCGSNANRILFIGMFGGGTANTPTITYGGASMTSIARDIQGGGDRMISLFYLLAPATGSNTTTVSFVSAPDHFGLFPADYDGVKQSGQPDGSQTATNGSGTTSLSAAVTVTASNCWMIAFGRENVGGAATWTAGTTNELQASGGGHFADSNATIGTGSVTDTITFGSANLTALIAASFQPDTGGGATRGLFQTPPVTGIGIGGSFFRDPLQSPAQMVRRDRIFVPARLAA